MGSQPMWKKEYGAMHLKNASILDHFGMYVPNHCELSETDIDLICGIVNNLTEHFVDDGFDYYVI